MDDLNKILLIIPYRGIGDIIFHIPIFKSIYSTYKNKITIITNKANKSDYLLKNEEYINDIIFENFDRENLVKNSISLIKKVNNINPDIMFLTHGSKRLVFPLFFSKPKKKIYFGRHSNNEDLASFLINEYKTKFRSDNFINEYNLKNFNTSNTNSILLNIDSHHNQNNWGEKNFINLTDKLLSDYKTFKVYINMSPNNKIYFENIIEKFKNNKEVNFLYNYSFDQILNVILNCKFVIGNESGPICISALFKKLTFSFFDEKTTAKSSKTIFENVNMYQKSISVDSFYFDFQNYIKEN